MVHRIREAMSGTNSSLLRGEDKIVEADLAHKGRKEILLSRA